MAATAEHAEEHAAQVHYEEYAQLLTSFPIEHERNNINYYNRSRIILFSLVRVLLLIRPYSWIVRILDMFNFHNCPIFVKHGYHIKPGFL